MGNIISNYNGEFISKTDTDLTSFSKIINDTLLELDLYTGNESRSEIDYSSPSFKNNRLKDASGNLIDINGLRYTTDEVITTNQSLSNKLSMDNSTPQSNKYYNMKRAFCNASNSVPVDLPGVDLPDDNKDPNYKQKIIDGVSFYSSKQAPLGVLNSVELDNCLKYGNIKGVASAPGIYIINSNTAYFYDSKYIDKNGDGRNSNAYVSVLKSKPIHLSPLVLDIATPDIKTPIGICKNDDSALIAIEYFPPTIINEYINNINCIGFYAEKNPIYAADTNIDPKKNGQVVIYPLMILPKGKMASRISEVDPINEFLTYLDVTKLISYDINDILRVKESDVNIGKETVTIVVTDSNNMPIVNPSFLREIRTDLTKSFPDDLNYTIFFKQKKIIDVNTISIADIDITKDTLNDFSNKSVYGITLSDECKVKINRLLTNSYIKADITKYSKLDEIYDPTIDDNNATNKGNYSKGNTREFGLYEKVNKSVPGVENTRMDNDISIRSRDTRIPFNNEKDAYNNYRVLSKVDANGESSIKDVAGSCNTFYQDLCDYYYNYDIVDGIIYNKTFIDARTTKKDMSDYLTNLEFLGSHIPDCKCKNNNYVKSNKIVGLDTQGLTVEDYFYVKEKCYYKSKIYGATDSSDVLNTTSGLGQIDTRTTDASNIKINDESVKDLNTMKDFNNQRISTDSQLNPYRRQIDPASSIQENSEMSDKNFLFAGTTGSARTITSTFNSYSCNLEFNQNISEVGGNVVTSGVSMACNFPGSETGSNTNIDNGSSTESSQTANTSTQILTRFDGEYYDYALTKQNIPLDGTSNIVINTSDIIKINVGLTSIYTFDFNDKFSFKFTNTRDNTFVNVDADNCKNLPAGSQCTRLKELKIPFLYGPINNDVGVKYTITLAKKSTYNGPPLTIPNNMSCELTLKQYSMKITNINIKSQQGKKVVAFSISLNTGDMIPKISYRVIFKSTINRADNQPHIITIKGTDLFSSVINNTGPLLIFDPNDPFIPTLKYTYEFKIYETQRIDNSKIPAQTIYSDGYILLYDDKMSSKYKDIIDFSTIKVGFNQFVLKYQDYNDNQKIISVANNDTIPMAANMVASWDFFTDDEKYSYINIYYKTNDLNSTKIKLNKIPIAISDNSYNFIFPLFPTSTVVIINACLVDIDGNDIITGINQINSALPDFPSVDFNLKSADVGLSFRSWKIVTTELFNPSSKNPIIISNSKNILSTIDYLSYANTNNYNNILFDYNDGQWYYTELALIPDTDTILSNNYVIFQKLPLPDNFIIDDITYLDENQNSVSIFDSTPTSSYSPSYSPSYSASSMSQALPLTLLTSTLNASPESLNIMIGTMLTIKWKYLPGSDIDIDIQLKIFNNINKAFTLPRGTTSGSYSFMLYDNNGNLDHQSTDVQLLSYETSIKSNIKKITSIVSDPGESTSIDSNDNITVSIKTPFIFIKKLDRRLISTIRTINLIIDDVLDNKFYIYFDNPVDNLAIASTNLNLSNINFAVPLEFIFGKKAPEAFSNVRFGLRKKYIEHFGEERFTADQINVNNQVHFDKLHFNYSNAGSNSRNKILVKATFNNYYSIYINTLIINIGSESLNEYKFNFDFNGLYLTRITNIVITNVIVIGQLTTKIFFEKELNGLQNVIYQDSIGNNTKLVFSNGYYSLPEDFESGPPPPIVVPPPAESGLPGWGIALIVIFILLGLGAIYYFLIRNKK